MPAKEINFWFARVCGVAGLNICRLARTYASFFLGSEDLLYLHSLIILALYEAAAEIITDDMYS